MGTGIWGARACPTCRCSESRKATALGVVCKLGPVESPHLIVRIERVWSLRRWCVNRCQTPTNRTPASVGVLAVGQISDGRAAILVGERGHVRVPMSAVVANIRLRGAVRQGQLGAAVGVIVAERGRCLCRHPSGVSGRNASMTPKRPELGATPLARSLRLCVVWRGRFRRRRSGRAVGVRSVEIWTEDRSRRTLEHGGASHDE